MENIRHDVHTSFILEPLENILKKGITPGTAIDDGINAFPIGEYFMQSLFLRMTGAQEQKMKCICWELATNNYQYRYEFLKNKSYGECSSYKDKNEILGDIFYNIGIQKSDGVFAMWDDVELDVRTIETEKKKWKEEEKKWRLKTIDKSIAAKKAKGAPLSPEQERKMRDGILGQSYDEAKFQKHLAKTKKEKFINKSLDEIYKLFDGTIMTKWSEREYATFIKKYKADFNSVHFCKDKGELLDSYLQNFYVEVVYNYRNRCAHNTVSYQRNLPSFDVLSDKFYYRQNFFFRYALLLLIDKIIVKAYKFYLCQKGCLEYGIG